jgi:hypothetical protein
VSGTEEAVPLPVEVLFPDPVLVALLAEPGSALLPEHVEPELPRGEHRAGAPPHQLAALVLGVRRNERRELVAVRSRGRQAFEDEPDPDFPHPEAPLGVLVREVGRLGQRPLEERDVVALELDQATFLEPTEGVYDPRAAEIDGPQPRARRQVVVLVRRMGRPAVVEGLLGVGDDRPDRRAHPLHVTELVRKRLVHARVVQHWTSLRCRWARSSSTPAAGRARGSTRAA